MTETEPVTTAQHLRLVARVDGLDGRLSDLHRKTIRELAGEVAALKRAIARLVEHEKAAGQPEWLGDMTADEAAGLLEATRAWADKAGSDLGLDVPQCWPWHRGAVALVLAAAVHYDSVIAGDRPEAVTDFMTRYIDAVTKRVCKLTGKCGDRRHFIGQAAYRYDLDPGRTTELAGWYADRAPGLAPALTPWEPDGR